jgi:hypothetical protein
MSDGWIGYCPERIDELYGRVRRAADDLLHIRSDDPAAAEALRVVRLARSHLELDWLPLLERIRASRAMTAPIAGASGLRAMAPPVDDDEMGPPSSLDVAAHLIESADDPGPSRRSGDVVLSNGWSWTCGPVSASTGQPASGCEFMPPTRWDLVNPVVLVASVLPVTGEVVDAVDCAVGAIPCEAVLLPGFSGRAEPSTTSSVPPPTRRDRHAASTRS